MDDALVLQLPTLFASSRISCQDQLLPTLRFPRVEQCSEPRTLPMPAD